MRAFRLQFCLLCVPSLVPTSAASSHGHFGAHQGRRYAAYDYDMTTPQYTPDGRLLQVEYATQACLREGSNPIVGVGIGTAAAEEEDAVLIMATVSSPPPPSPSSPTSNATPSRTGAGPAGLAKQDATDLEASTQDSNQRAQFRIIEVPLSSSYCQSSLQQTSTSTILIGLSGLLSDATALLHIAYSQLEEEQHMFGWHRLGLSPVGISTVASGTATRAPAPRKHSQPVGAQPSETARRLARAVSGRCQTHAFGGGLRPYGASLFLAGVDAAPGPRVAMCETHPNGGGRSRAAGVASADGAGHRVEAGGVAQAPQIMVSGGPAAAQDRLKRSIQSRLRRLRQQPSTLASSDDNHIGTDHNDSAPAAASDGDTLFLRQVLRSVISSLVEEWGSRWEPPRSSAGAALVTAAGTASDDRRSPAEQKRRPPRSALPLMEVVIASPTRGTVRLTQREVSRLMQPM